MGIGIGSVAGGWRVECNPMRSKTDGRKHSFEDALRCGLFLRAYWQGLRVDIFSQSPRCNPGGGGNHGTVHTQQLKFYNTTLPAPTGARGYLERLYGRRVFEHFVCTEGMTGNAHPVAAPIPLTDLSPALRS